MVFTSLSLGCAGYHLGTTNGHTAGARSVQVKFFKNETFEPRLAIAVNRAMKREFQKDGTYSLETQSEGDLIVTGKLINFIFLEELEDFKLSGLAQNAIYGGVAGAIYKSTRGVRPMMLSAMLGATIGSGYAYLWKEGYFDIGKSSNQHFGNIQMGKHRQ